MRFNLLNSLRPVVRYRAVSVSGDIFTRTFAASRRPEDGASHDLAEHVARAARTLEADPWLTQLEVITGRTLRAAYVRDFRRIQ